MFRRLLSLAFAILFLANCDSGTLSDGSRDADPSRDGDSTVGDPDGSTDGSTDARTDASTDGPLDVRFEVVQFELPSVEAPTTLTVPLSAGFGVPKGIIMIQTADRTDPPFFDGTGYNNGSFQIGFSDGANHVCIHGQHDSEVTPGQKSFRTMYNDQISVRTQSTGNDGIRNRVSVSAFNTDEVVLRIDEIDFPDGEEFECFLIAIGGRDVESVIAGHYDDLGTGTGAVPVTIGHAPDMIFTLSDHDSSFNFKGETNRSADEGANVSYGVAINDGINSQMSVAWSSPHAPTSDPAANTVGIYSNSVLASTADGAVENFSVAVTGFTTTGIEVTSSASAANAIFGYLSIEFARSVEMAIVDTTIPTSGDMSVVGAGFTPGFALALHMGGATSYSTPVDASFSLATHMLDGSNAFSHMNSGLDGVTNTDRGAWGRGSDAFEMLNAGGANEIDVEAAGHTFTSDGVNIAMTNWPESPILGRMLLLGVD